LPDFWDYYSWIESALKLSADEFAKDQEVRDRAVKWIKGLIAIISEQAGKLLESRLSVEKLPVKLASVLILCGRQFLPSYFIHLLLIFPRYDILPDARYAQAD